VLQISVFHLAKRYVYKEWLVTYVNRLVPLSSKLVPSSRVPPILVKFTVGKTIGRRGRDQTICRYGLIQAKYSLGHLGECIADTFEYL
jgi:hypothetical protein